VAVDSWDHECELLFASEIPWSEGSTPSQRATEREANGIEKKHGEISLP
jgi:hypothetical protein